MGHEAIKWSPKDLNCNDTVVEKVGSYESRYFENDNNMTFWPLPNVIGVRRKGIAGLI